MKTDQTNQFLMHVEYGRLNAIVAASLMLPAALFVLGGGDFEYYRIGQSIWILLSAILLVHLIVQKNKKFSVTYKYLIFVIWLATLISHLLSLFQGDAGVDLDTFGKLALFTVVISIADLNRDRGFKEYLRPAVPLAIFVVLLTIFHFWYDPHLVWGRYTFFGWQPNWGGEILFGSLLIISVLNGFFIRCLFAVLIISALVLLQSRAALLGSLMYWIGLELFVNFKLHKRLNWLKLVGLIMPIPLLLFLVLLIPDILEGLVVYFSSEVLLLDDPNRGLGTGLVGRLESFEVFGELISQNLFMGVGLDNAIWTGKGGVHNGYLALTAEFGLISIFVWAVFFRSAYISARLDLQRALALFAMLFMFFFSARTINLNIFPFLLWVLLLPWKPNEIVASKPLKLTVLAR